MDTVTTYADFSSGLIRTILYLTRDNTNYIENYVDRALGIKINKKRLKYGIFKKLRASISCGVQANNTTIYCGCQEKLLFFVFKGPQD